MSHRGGTPPQLLRATLLQRPVLFRMVLSCVILVLLVALCLGTASYLLFQKSYNEELERLHRTYVQDVEMEARRAIVETAKIIFMECATEFLVPSNDFLGEEETLEGNHGKLFLTHRRLRELATKNGRTVDNIHLYYKKADLLVSTSFGLKLDASAYVPASGEEWIRELTGKPAENRWVGVGSSAFMMVLRFPILSVSEDATVVLAVEFRAETLRTIFARLPAEAMGVTYAFDTQERAVVSSAPEQTPPSGLSRAWRDAMASADGSVARRVGGVSSLITATAWSDTGWTIVNVIPLTSIYRRTEYVRLLLILASFAAVALGGFAAVMIALKIYTPIGQLLGKVRSLSREKFPAPAEGGSNEFAVLGYAIDGLSSRMGELAATLEANRNAIKHDLVTRLLNGEMATMEEYAAAAGLLGIATVHPHYRAALLVPSIDGNAAGLGEMRLMALRIAEETERTGEGRVMATALPDSSVGIVIGEPEGMDRDVQRLAESWTSHGVLPVPVQVVLGRPVEVPTDLPATFLEVSRAASYRFFFPERKVLADNRGFLAREERSCGEGRALREAFMEALRLRRRGDAVESLSALREFARSDRASAGECRGELKAVSAGILEYARDMKLEAAVPSLKGSLDLVDVSRDIDDFLERVTFLMDRIHAALNAREGGRTSAHVEAAKRYVEEGFSSSLSLDGAAEAAGISPGHLSKLFKAETGATFVSWVSAFRLERAERLLRESGLSVHEIGSICGMNTPAYFIRQFKARYGLTPFDYRRTNRGIRK